MLRLLSRFLRALFQFSKRAAGEAARGFEGNRAAGMLFWRERGRLMWSSSQMVFQAGGTVEPCTVCTSPANVLQKEFGWGTVVDCSRCGDYSVERVTCDDARLPLGDAKQRALASHLIRKLQGGRRPYLTTDFFRSLEERSLPTPAEASDSLLLWYAESADGHLGK